MSLNLICGKETDFPHFAFQYNKIDKMWAELKNSTIVKEFIIV